MSASKKAKMDDFDILRQYIMNCPDVPKESPAVQAALKGLEKEVQKRERDAKLQQKFSKNTSSNSTKTDDNTINSMKIGDSNNGAAATTGTSTSTFRQNSNNSKEVTANEEDDNDDDDDWHDVSSTSHEGAGAGEDYDAESSALGVSLSKVVIASIAEAQIEVETPTAAIALALHAALRSHLLGFVCTGIPDDGKATAGGFAPPIRELPKTQFIPPKWDEHATRQGTSSCANFVTLRYRKAGTGSVVLVVTLEDDNTERNVRIQLIPTTTNTQEPPNAEGMVVALHQHFNPDSFAAAAMKQGKVQPALHYKRLAVLLTAFMNRFDLGQVKENSDAPMEDAWQKNCNTTAAADHPLLQHTTIQSPNFAVFQDPLRVPGHNSFPGPFFMDPSDRRGPQIDVFDRRYPTSDFAGDLMPGGLVYPNFGGGGGGRPSFGPAGNLMGPDHPIFNGGGDSVGFGGISGVGPRSGYGMKPRFDPFGPPGGPTEPLRVGKGNKPSVKIPPGGMGEPNHDHMRPPNNLNNNMYG